MKFNREIPNLNVANQVPKSVYNNGYEGNTIPKFNFMKRSQEVQAAPVDNSVEKEKVKQVAPESNWSTQKILPKFVNKGANASYGSAVEFLKSAFDLCKRDENGFRESLDGKLLMNFWTFDTKTNRQLTLLPTYIDISEWLSVCHMITSGLLHENTAIAKAKQQQSNYKYCSYVYQNSGGSYKPIFKLDGKQFGGKNNQPIATVFKITPSNRDGYWTFSSEIYDGKTSSTGLIEVMPNAKPYAKVTVLLSYNDLVKIARMSEMVIMSHFVKMK